MTAQESNETKKSQVDILFAEIDKALIEMGLKPAVYGNKKGSGVYIPKQKKQSQEK